MGLEGGTAGPAAAVAVAAAVDRADTGGAIPGRASMPAKAAASAARSSSSNSIEKLKSSSSSPVPRRTGTAVCFLAAAAVTHATHTTTKMNMVGREWTMQTEGRRGMHHMRDVA